MMNSESEDLSASSAGEEGEGGLAVLKESTTYVPQNSGSEQEDEPVERQAGRTKGLSAGGKSASRSRSRGRVPRYDVQLNSESSSDEVEVESLGPALTVRFVSFFFVVSFGKLTDWFLIGRSGKD